MRNDPFKPFTSTSVVTAAAAVLTQLGRGSCVRVCNLGTFALFVKFGKADVVADANSIAIPPNVTAVFDVSPDTFSQADTSGLGQTHISHISPGGAGSVNIATGEGGLSA